MLSFIAAVLIGVLLIALFVAFDRINELEGDVEDLTERINSVETTQGENTTRLEELGGLDSDIDQLQNQTSEINATLADLEGAAGLDFEDICTLAYRFDELEQVLAGQGTITLGAGVSMPRYLGCVR
jgi:predicted nuclease with TOPRIM domain